MAYNASGGWDYEDDGVAKRIAAITTGNSPMMKQAAAGGMQAANRRGLGNSSMAVGAAQSEVIRAAAPIASQEAQQTYGKNLQEQQGRQAADLTERQISANDRAAMLQAMTELNSQAMNATATTLANEKIPAGTRSAVQSSFNDRVQQVYNYLQNLYGVRLNSSTPTAPSTPGGLPGLPGGAPIMGLGG